MCPATDNEENSVGFLLQRRVVESSDGILALRPYRSRAVEEAARRAVIPGSSRGAAQVESVVVRSALEGLRVNSLPTEVADLPAANDRARTGDLRAETEWLPAIADAYVRTPHPCRRRRK